MRRPRADRVEVRTPRDQHDIVAVLGQSTADHAPDGARPVHDEPHPGSLPLARGYGSNGSNCQNRPMPMYKQILRSAERWKENFQSERLDAVPARQLVVLACMDARLDLFRFLGLEIGHSHILRNAGGRVTDDALRSMIVSSVVLGTREVVVIHHTKCGMHGVTNEALRERIKESSGHDPW